MDVGQSSQREAVRDGRSPKGERRETRINTPEDELRHDVTDELAAYKLAQLPFPGVFGVFYESDRPTKNALEQKWIATSREKVGNASDLDLLQKTSTE
jgi:hypothetical protein